MAQNKVQSWALFKTENPMKLMLPHSTEQEEFYSMELMDGFNVHLIIGKGIVVPLHAIKAHSGSRCTAPLTFNLGTTSSGCSFLK